MADVARDGYTKEPREERGIPVSMCAVEHCRYLERRVPLTVAAAFVLLGMVWVILSDIILYLLMDDRAIIARIETAKGWLFVGVAGALLYSIVQKSITRSTRVWRITNALVESIADGVILVGRNRTIAYANPAAVRMLGLPLEKLVGMNAEEFSQRFRVSSPRGRLVPPERFAAQRVFEERGPLRYRAMLYPCHGGELYFVATAAAVRVNGGDAVEWVVSVLHDITENEKLDRTRDAFFAAAAHALKTPVAIIKANAQTLAPHVPASHQALAKTLERQCNRIDRLVQNLLILARARSHDLELHPTRTDIGALVTSVVEDDEWDHRHRVRAHIEQPVWGFVDPERITLALQNLVQEATRLSVVQSTVTVAASVQDDHGSIVITYTPLPWCKEARELYGEYDDVGLGRSVIMTIIEAHGGALTEESSNTTTQLRVQLPLFSGAQHGGQRPSLSRR